ncbi:MAG: hypothetical protein IPK61_00010 [Saprospiraceae bacterium]|nr:hypothetical protein [Saprospiraceae bacterium]
MYIQERPDGNLILLGSSFDFQTDTAAILYSIIDTSGKIIHEFKDTRNYEQIEYWRCKPCPGWKYHMRRGYAKNRRYFG